MQLILDILPCGPKPRRETQVHLAQLKYLLPRLVGQGNYAQPSGWGMVPVDLVKASWNWNRRSVRNQITDIERQLKVVEKNRATVRENVWSQYL